MGQVHILLIWKPHPTSVTYQNTGLKPDTFYYFKTSKPAGGGSLMTVAVAIAVNLSTIGANGLTTHVGVSAANPLRTGEVNTIRYFSNAKSSYDFLSHARVSPTLTTGSRKRFRNPCPAPL